MGNGEALSPDDIYEIYRKSKMEVREIMGLNVNTLNKRGEVEDYLEIRRPLMHNNRQKI